MGLTPFLIVVIVLLAVTGVLARRLLQQRGVSAGPTTFPYYARKALFTAAERSFLGVLEQAVEGRYRVFGKVRLGDVLGVKGGTPAAERRRALNRVLAKHVDFVLCHPETLSIAALVELDDSSHRRPSRRARDAFLQRACAVAGMPLVRFPVRASYALGEVHSKIPGLEGTPASPAPGQRAAPMTGRPRAEG